MSVCRGAMRSAGSRGFTLIELIVVIAILVLVMGTLLNRVLYYQEQAEKTAMEGVLAAIQSALVMQYGQLATRGKPKDAELLAQINPLELLQEKPRNYLGEYYDPTPQSIVGGGWMFDLKARDLIYVPKRASYLEPGKDGRKWIRFHVVLNYAVPLLPSLHQEQAALSGILIAPVAPYLWF